MVLGVRVVWVVREEGRREETFFESQTQSSKKGAQAHNKKGTSTAQEKAPAHEKKKKTSSVSTSCGGMRAEKHRNEKGRTGIGREEAVKWTFRPFRHRARQHNSLLKSFDLVFYFICSLIFCLSFESFVL